MSNILGDRFVAKDKTSVGRAFEVEELKAILKTLEEFGVTEFELRNEGLELRLKRGNEMPPVSAQASLPSELPSSPSADIMRRDVMLSVVEGMKKESPAYREVKSPMVGTFYRRPSVDAKPYIEVGDVVKPGTVLCIVEAMKLMNEIESDVAGKIVEVCLEDGQMAEYGEVLFRIEPVSI